MKNYRTLMALALVLFGQAFCLYAQDYKVSKPPTPTEPTLFSPESGLYRASMGTIRSDIDRFMDVGSFKDTSFTRMLTYTGFDPQGITIGAGMKLGNLYFGAAYGGSLIQDLFSRATNQDPSELNIELSTAGGSKTEVPGVFDASGDRPAEVKNRNEFNIFLGIWRVGLKIGFSQILTVNQPQGDEDEMKIGGTEQSFAFENVLVPSLALGASFPVSDSLFLIPRISAQLDIHQFVQGSDPHIDGTNAFYSGYAQSYNEARVGADLGVEFRSGNGEFRAGAGYYLTKRISGFDIKSGAKITHVVVDNGAEETVESVYDNLEQQIAPYILYTGTINERAKFGVKLLADVRFNESFLTPDSGQQLYGDYETKDMEIYVRPELDFGGTFALLPDRFSLHAGFGLNLHTFNIKATENKSTGETGNSFQETLPSTRFAVGFTVNLNANTMIDMLLITSGKFDFKNEPDYNDISALRRSAQDNNKFTLFLTMRR
ncbi:MAG: hypothetical protein LBD86_05395 [Spirochaetaceae bacterium]|nr:hypothetical protein [Spirochaetaceae bacterium]